MNFTTFVTYAKTQDRAHTNNETLKNVYDLYNKFQLTIDDCAYYLFKNQKAIEYTNNNPNQNIINSIQKYKSTISSFMKGSVSNTVRQTILELDTILNAYTTGDETTLKKSLSTFAKTTVLLKHQYFVTMSNAYNREIRFLKTWSDIHSKNQLYVQESSLQYGDVLLYFNLQGYKLPIDIGIMRMTKSRISHVGMYCGNASIFEADLPGVTIRPLYDYRNQVIVVLRAALSDTDIGAIREIVSKLASKKIAYGYREIVGQAFYQKLGIFPRIFKNKQTFFCSELIDYIYKEINHPLVAGSGSHHVVPGDFIDSRYLQVVGIVDGTKKNSSENYQTLRSSIEKTLALYTKTKWIISV